MKPTPDRALIKIAANNTAMFAAITICSFLGTYLIAVYVLYACFYTNTFFCCVLTTVPSHERRIEGVLLY